MMYIKATIAGMLLLFCSENLMAQDWLMGDFISITPIGNHGDTLTVLTRGQSYDVNFDVTYSNVGSPTESFHIIADSNYSHMLWFAYPDLILGTANTVPLDGSIHTVQINNLSLPAGVHKIYIFNDYAAFTSKVFTVVDPLGINNIGQSNQITIYPNPVASKLSITSPDIITGMTIKNVLGQSVFCQDGNGGKKVDIDIETLASGTYFLEAKGPAGVITERFVKM